MLRKLFPLQALCCMLVSFVVAQDTIQRINGNRVNSPEQQSKPYVILISADGFRSDFATKYHAPNLLRLREQGVTAEYMQPSYPTLTFPNHYSIVTGLYPSHHGLVDNSYYDGNKKGFYTMRNRAVVEDGSWYGGTPLWVLAEQQKMVTASFYWVGAEADIQGIRPTYYYVYNEAIPIDRRLNTVKNWLQLPAEKRPHLVTFYLPEVDHEAHMFGPDSREAEHAVHFVDTVIGKMKTMLDSLNLPINYVFVSDHGMLLVDSNRAIAKPVAIDTTKFIMPSGDALVRLYAKDKKDIMPAFRALKKEAVNYDVYLLTKTPKRWHYRKSDDRYNRMGDILLVPQPPAYFNLWRRPNNIIGKHGFDNNVTEMRASFYAWGPAFKSNLKIDGFANIHVYPMIASILGLTYTHNIDGDPKVLQPILK